MLPGHGLRRRRLGRHVRGRAGIRVQRQRGAGGGQRALHHRRQRTGIRPGRELRRQGRSREDRKPMIRAVIGAVLLGAAGPLVFAAGFLPWGHSRTHWGVLTETVDSLFDRPDEEPLTKFEAAYWGGEVVGLAYPMVAGLAFFLSAFRARSRDAAGAVFVLHIASFMGLAVAAGTLIFLPETARSGKPGEPPWRFILAGVAALMVLLVLMETRVVVRAARRARAGVRPPGFAIDR